MDEATQAVIDDLKVEFEAAKDAFEADNQSEDKLIAFNEAMQNLAMATRASRAGRSAMITTE